MNPLQVPSKCFSMLANIHLSQIGNICEVLLHGHSQLFSLLKYVHQQFRVQYIISHYFHY